MCLILLLAPSVESATKSSSKVEIRQIYTCSLILDAGQDLKNVKSRFVDAVSEFTAE